MFNFSSASYHYPQFKDEVEEALVNEFGRKSVYRGNKAFDIKANTHRVDADVAPFFEHRRYSKNGRFISGVQLLSDNGGKVVNWPEQHYDNGVSKNSECNKRYKRSVRILKKLCNEMEENKVFQAYFIPGFLIECLVWNVPNKYFGQDSYYLDVKNVLAYLFNNTRTDKNCSEWGEVSELKYLFRSNQAWTRQQAHNFIDAAWDYVGFNECRRKPISEDYLGAVR